jgi:hypothetical protein
MVSAYSTMFFDCLGYTVVNDGVNVSDEFEKMWKKMIVVQVTECGCRAPCIYEKYPLSQQVTCPHGPRKPLNPKEE